MKFKTTEPDEKPNNIHEILTDIIQLEFDKFSLCYAAKLYFWNSGLINYKKFFKKVKSLCFDCIGEYIGLLNERQEEIPEFKVQSLSMKFESKEQPFEFLSELEDDYINRVKDLAGTAIKEGDYQALSFALEHLKHAHHFACIALEAVKNEQNPLDVLPKDCE